MENDNVDVTNNDAEPLEVTETTEETKREVEEDGAPVGPATVVGDEPAEVFPTEPTE